METTERLQGRHGRYELVDPKPVMFGRLSAFFSARDERTGGEVLVKRFTDLTSDDSPVQSFYREVDTIFGLKHPNILPIIDYGEGNDTTAPFLVLPWCKGGNLRQLSRQQDFLPLETAMHLLRQTASAIDYAHQQGVIHGDIKPENILLSDDKRSARLADFGMAKHFEVTDRVVSKELVVDGGGGTSAYLSPEQLSNNVQTPRSDIYSFGLVAYELLAGRLPFDLQAPLYRQLQARVAGDLVDPQVANPALSITVRDALNCALASDAAARPASAQEFCDMLMGLRRPVSKPVPKSGRRRPNAIWQDLEPAGKAAVVGAAIAAGGGIVVALVQLLPKLVGSNP